MVYVCWFKYSWTFFKFLNFFECFPQVLVVFVFCGFVHLGGGGGFCSFVRFVLFSALKLLQIHFCFILSAISPKMKAMLKSIST